MNALWFIKPPRTFPDHALASLVGVGDVVAGVAIGRLEKIRIVRGGIATARTTQSQKSPSQLRCAKDRVLEPDGGDDGPADRSVIGAGMSTLHITERRSLMGVVAIPALLRAAPLRREGAVDADLCGGRAPLDRVQLIASEPELERGIEQRQLRRACDEGCDLRLGSMALSDPCCFVVRFSRRVRSRLRSVHRAVRDRPKQKVEKQPHAQ